MLAVSYAGLVEDCVCDQTEVSRPPVLKGMSLFVLPASEISGGIDALSVSYCLLMPTARP